MRNALRRLVQRFTGIEQVQQRLDKLELQIANQASWQDGAHAALLALLETIHGQQQEFAATLEHQQNSLKLLRKQLSDAVKKEALNTVCQIQAFLNLQALWHGSDRPLPSMHGWPVSADAALLLAELLQGEHYDLVVEFGSGSSTVIMSRILQQLSHGRLISFDHLPQYYEQTAAMLERNILTSQVDLVLAPLEPLVGSDGREYLHYDCNAVLAKAALELQAVQHPKLLVFVDGPPGSTGPQARYPALDAVLKHFPSCEVHCLLDDYGRQDERNIVKAWEVELQCAGRHYTHTVLALQKGASLLRIEAVAQANTESLPLKTTV